MQQYLFTIKIKILQELLLFENLKRMRIDSNVINFWKNDAAVEFPILKKIANIVLLAPIAETDVERLFSHLNFILNKYRSTLSGPLLEDIMILRLNKV